MSRVEGASRRSALSVCLDANVWVSYLMAQVHDRETVITDLVGMVDGSSPAPIPMQLSLSHELLDTIERVLLREGVGPVHVAAFLRAVLQIEQTGPLRPGPTFLIAGRDQLAMRDREDAGVLASCIAGRVDVLVTDNLEDFETNDSERFNTRMVNRRDARTRQLFALIHERTDGVSLVIMHPLDVTGWLRAGVWPIAQAVRQRYAQTC